MFKNPLLAWFIAVLALGVAGYSWVRTNQAVLRAEKAEAILDSQHKLQTAGDMQPATFVSADAQHITYRIAKQSNVNGEVFVNYEEHTARYGPELEIGGVEGDGLAALGSIPSGKPIYLRLVGDTTKNDALVEAIFVTP